MYLDSETFAFRKDSASWIPLKAFDSTSKNDSDYFLPNKLRIINEIRGEDKEKITRENLEAFEQTEEYQTLLKKIQRITKVYDKVLAEYLDWEKQFDQITFYIDTEREREELILQRKKLELFAESLPSINKSILETVQGQNLEKQVSLVFGSFDIKKPVFLEYFSKSSMETLRDKNIQPKNKFMILYYQTYYLKNMGVKLPNDNTRICESSENIDAYLKFLDQEEIKKLIPSCEVAERIKSLREKKLEEATKEFITTGIDYKRLLSTFTPDSNNEKVLYNEIKNNKVCVLGQGAKTEDGKFISIVFYTVRSSDSGILFHTFAHEMGHVIDQTSKGCGFEPIETYYPDALKNRYDSTFRKYEKFNEVLTDMFTYEVVDYFHDQQVYFIEPRKYSKDKALDSNTSEITKNLLKPLLERFRQQVLDAKINVDQSLLTRYIGEDNFEDLVDAVNKVDYLSQNGLLQDLREEEDTANVREYNAELEKVAGIYLKIDDYYESHFHTSPKNNQRTLGNRFKNAIIKCMKCESRENRYE